MTNLAFKGDDFPAAAEKNLRDARALLASRRWDGAAYLSGYAVECSLKTILLLEALARTCGATTLASLLRASSTSAPTASHEAIRKKIRHDLSKALKVARGIQPVVGLHSSAVTARYLHAGWCRLSLCRHWRETMRYGSEGMVARTKARTWVRGAESMVAQTVTQMRADGVVA